MKRVSFSVSFPAEMAHPLHRRIVDGTEVSRADLLMWGPMTTISTLLWIDGPPDVATDVLDAVDSTTATNLVAGDDGTYAFVHQTEYEFPDRLLELVAESRVVYLPPIRFYQDGTVQFEVTGEAALLAAFSDELADLAEVTIERVREFDRWGSPATLTERQEAALDAAVDVGYYHIPRSGDVEAVAERLDCASSTAGELLRKAESSVIREFTEGR